MNDKSTSINLIPIEIETNELDLNLVSKQFQETKRVMEMLGIASATFKTGQTYKQNEEQTVLAADGILVLEKENVTVLAIRHEGSKPEDAMNELNEFSVNQRELGSFVGKSQPWVSSNLEEDDD